jgi:hypothetical protein
MGSSTLAGRTNVDFAKGDRIDVTDAAGVRIGWVDPRTGVRNLLAPGRREEFDQMIDYWLTAAGLNAPHTPDEIQADTAIDGAPIGNAPNVPTKSDPAMHIREVRYPDAEVIRSLLIPLRRLP